MKLDKEDRSPEEGALQPGGRPYHKPEILELGAILDLTRNFLNGTVDPIYGSDGSGTGFRGPRRA